MSDTIQMPSSGSSYSSGEAPIQQKNQNNKMLWKVATAFGVCSLSYFALAAITASKVNCEEVQKAFDTCHQRHGFSRWSGSDNPSAEIAFRVAMLPWDLLGMAVSCPDERAALNECRDASSLLKPVAGVLASLGITCLGLKKLNS